MRANDYDAVNEWHWKPDPHSTVQQVRDLQNRRDGLLEKRVSRAGMWALHRLATRRSEAQLNREISALNSDLRRACGQLAGKSVGATPGVWGPFSGSERYNLEATLTSLPGRLASGHAATDGIVALLQSLPALRLAAHEGDASASSWVEAKMGELVSQVDNTNRRVILEHLSGWRRPLPRTLRELNRHREGGQAHFVTLWVAHPAEHHEHLRPNDYLRRIKIHDIVVEPSLRGMGLGSAVLVELCRLADATDATLVGELGPGHCGDEQRMLKQLAHWYGQHGFDCGDTTRERLHRGQHIVRYPGASLPREGGATTS